MYQHIWICQLWIFEIEGSHLYFQKAKKNTGRSLCCSGASKRFFLPIALVAQVVHEEKANHNQPKDQQKMMNFHGNLLF